MMNISTLGTSAVLSFLLVMGLGAGCAGDDDKQVPADGGAGGEAGDSGNNGGSSSNNGGSSSNDGGSSVGAGGDVGGAGAGSSGTSAGGVGGDTSSVGGSGEGGDLGTAPIGGSAGAAESGAAGAPLDAATPVPIACVGCASDFCVQARVACQADATCVACRDEDYKSLTCAQNVAFTNWLTCICATGCSAVCSSLCGS